jgi:geranylgeranyl pyrophosphate synthase
MTIEKDIEHLKRHDSFNRFIDLIKQMREECIGEMHEVPTDKLQQLSGRILSYDQIITMASWAETSPNE